MAIFALSFAIVLLAILGMAIGILAGRQPIINGCGQAREGGCNCANDGPCGARGANDAPVD